MQMCYNYITFHNMILVFQSIKKYFIKITMLKASLGKRTQRLLAQTCTKTVTLLPLTSASECDFGFATKCLCTVGGAESAFFRPLSAFAPPPVTLMPLAPPPVNTTPLAPPPMTHVGLDAAGTSETGRGSSFQQ